MSKIKIIIVLNIIISLLGYSNGHTQTPRKKINLNDDWQFHFAYDFTKNAKIQQVTLPHTWNAQEALAETANYNRTSAIYQKQLNMLPEWAGKRLFLYFEGANSVATVFINNKFVIEHKGGYTAFCVEITDSVKVGKNLLTVQVSNAYRLDVLPLHGDFNVYGGIHRPVYLLITEQNCISPLDYASSGVYISQKKINQQQAEVATLTKLSIKNNTGLKLKTTILDHNKKIVATDIAPLTNQTEVTQNYTISKPSLWDGKKNPYLYSVEVSLLQNNEVIDQIVQPLGLRYYHVDPNQGFFLNGQYLDLYGVGRHEDVAGKGSALQPVDHEQDMALIKELGATAARLTHYPQNHYFYDLADQNGIVLWSEIPFVGPGGYNGTGFVNSEPLKQQVKQNLIELIRQNYNHPSIFFWGIFNELKLNYDNPAPFIKELNAIAKQEDPYRLTVLASNLKANQFNNLTDLMAWNQYFGWYGSRFDEVATWADETHHSLPKVPIALSEYGAGASPFKHTEVLAQPSPAGKFHPEEWQTAFHEAHWKLLEDRPFLWGKFIWVLADFGSSIRTEGDQDGINDKGLVTYDRKVKKDAFYFYKANWSQAPVLYIAERRNTQRRIANTKVKIYSNIEEVELWVNGVKQGKAVKNGTNTLQWDYIKLTKGKNIITAKAKVNGKLIADQCEWTLQTDH